MDDLTIYRDPLLPPAVEPEQLAALVWSRLCHDIVSPLGAIGNGLEPVSYTHLDVYKRQGLPFLLVLFFGHTKKRMPSRQGDYA